MRELSIFVDESGGQEGHSKYYAITLVFHDQADSIEDMIARHRESLQIRGLKEIPFHAGPLMTGHDAYAHLDMKTRKMHFAAFFMTLQHLPIKYHTFLYKRSDIGGAEAFIARMRRDVANFLFDGLGYFQSFDKVKLYYDNGQDIVAKSLHAALDYALSKDAVMYRKTNVSDFLLAQAADMLCTLELTAQKYEMHEETRTDMKMFGTAGKFKNNYMKSAKRKRL